MPADPAWIPVVRIDAPDRLTLTGGAVVRLAGIAGTAGWELAATDEVARAYVAGRLANTEVAVLPVGDTDRHGRTPAAVFLRDGTLLQQTLVAAGHARVRALPGEEACHEELLATEDLARRGAVGMWASPQTAIRSAEDSSLAERNGLYELVQGRVLSVGAGTRMIFLDFGRNYRQDFTVMVPPAVAKALADKGFAMESLEGRDVLVRGVIEESGGPAIRLGHPADIVLID